MTRVRCYTAIVITLLLCSRVECAYSGRRCTSSSQCRIPPGSCCRTSTGIVDRQEGELQLLGTLTKRTGVCGRVSKRGEPCIPSMCGCETGSTCYRPIQGVCCAMYRCHDAAWVKQQQEFWKKCLSEKSFCHLPMAAPPAGGPGLL